MGTNIDPQPDIVQKEASEHTVLSDSIKLFTSVLRKPPGRKSRKSSSYGLTETEAASTGPTQACPRFPEYTPQLSV